MDTVPALTIPEILTKAGEVAVTRLNGHGVPFKLLTQGTRTVMSDNALFDGTFQIDAGGILSLGGVTYGPPSGEAVAGWAELIEGLRHANELARLARALVYGDVPHTAC